MDTDATFFSSDLFEEPQQFFPPKSMGTLASYNTITTETDLQINLIGSSPLYGHILTHACLYLAKYLETNADKVVKDKTILEVGAGGGLPSILTAHLNAEYVVCTDYPDPELITNLQKNIHNNNVANNASALGYIWGHDTTEIVQTLKNKVGKESFDVIILSDVIFNHSEHYQLLKTCKELIKPQSGKILVTFSPHRPKLLKDDLMFFERAQEDQFGFTPEFIEMEHWSPLFKNDKDESTVEIRSRVYFYILHSS